MQLSRTPQARINSTQLLISIYQDMSMLEVMDRCVKEVWQE